MITNSLKIRRKEKGLRIVLPRASLVCDGSGLRVKRHWTQVRCLLHRSQPVPIRNFVLIWSRVTRNECLGLIVICPSLGTATDINRLASNRVNGRDRCFRTSTAALHVVNASERRTQNITSCILAFLSFSFRKHLSDIELMLNKTLRRRSPLRIIGLSLAICSVRQVVTHSLGPKQATAHTA